MRESFRRELIDSGYLHMLLKLPLERSTEARLLAKPVRESRPLWYGRDLSAWSKDGVGEISLNGDALRLTAPSRLEPREPMAHYTGYSAIRAILDQGGADWRSYNRVVCRVKPGCDGFHMPFLTICLRNDGVEKIPDIYHREGFHVINLQNHKWNECVWEFPDLSRDRVTELSFALDCHGTERGGHKDFVFDIADIRLERVEDPDVSLGWQGNSGTISFSTTGYWTSGRKVAVANHMSGAFRLLNESGKTVYTGDMKPWQNEKGDFGILDFTEFEAPGRYLLQAGEYTTEPFAIDDHVMDEAAWKVLNYVYSERCGYPVGGGHSSCHADIIAEHDGKTLTYNGGWHDAGDVSQQTLQSGEMVEALLELAVRVKDDTLLYRRLVEEARWGLDFIIRMRFGDGYRAFSAGMSRWSDGFIGGFDDEAARVHNRSFDNFLLSGVEAYAGAVLREEDIDLAWVAVNAAKEDYSFALDRFNEVGVEQREVMEHTHNASLSQYYAVASWAASQIFAATGEDYYALEAARFIDLMITCQDRGEAKLPFTGFFYRDDSKKAIVHFNHQSREHIFAQALYAVCTTQNDHADLPKWEEAMCLYGEYQKAMTAYASPYGMLPAGVHAFDEPEDKETFPLLHVYTDYEQDKNNYAEQLKSGVPVGEHHCVRQFPVWFSFRGNTAVHLSAGKAASLCGRYFGDDALLEIARDQLYWEAGKNPFRQSLIYGEGSNYAQQYAALCGETVGELPVGIQTRTNEDVPYWPMANNATYKEIWMTSAGHWLRLLADLY